MRPRHRGLWGRSETVSWLVDAPDVTQGVGDLAAGGAERVKCAGDGPVVPLGAQHGEALPLVGLDLRVDAQRLVRLFSAAEVLVDAHDGASAAVDLLGDAVGGRLDLVLLEALLDGGGGAAPVLDRLD